MSSMGMDKSGTFALATNTTASVTGWAARSGYPSTVIDSNTSLKADVAAPVIIQCKVTLTAAWSSGSGLVLRVLKNGVSIGTATIAFNTTTITFTNISTTVAANDLIALQYTTPFGSAGTIQTGAAATYLFYDQQPTSYNVDGTRALTFATSGTLALQRLVDGTRPLTFGTSGLIGLLRGVDGTRPFTFGRSGTIYKGQFYNVDGARPLSFTATGSILKIPKPTPLPSVFDVQDISMSVHTVDGRMIGDFPCNIITAFQWGREQNEVSTASYDVGGLDAVDLAHEIIPWVHWTTIWHDGEPVWTGPIQSAKGTRNSATISARDTATLLWRTRVPVTRTWTDTHTEDIAFDLWQQMLQLHKVRATPVVLSEVVRKSFTITAKAEQRMLNQVIDDLAKVGLIWTVVAGRPVLGVFSRDPVVSLEECDIMAELEWLRDGSQTFNDVRVQGQNWAQTAVADLAGLRLQTLVSMDDMFGASNIQRATLQYAQDSARIKDQLVVPGSASLHPQAPVSLNDLVPGKVWAVHTDTASQLMRLDQVSVTGSPGSIDVQVGLVALEQQDEIAQLVGGGGTA